MLFNNFLANCKPHQFQVNSNFYESVKTPRKEQRGVRNDYGKFGSIVGESMPIETRKEVERSWVIQSYK